MSGRWPELERRLCLHSDVSLFYVVDGYEAAFSTEDGLWVSGEHAPTLEEALDQLDRALVGVRETR